MDSAVEFQGLVLGHLDSLYNYALVLTRRTEDAEDLLQEVLVRGFQSFATYDRSLSFKGWMFTIIKNTYIDRFRRQRRLPQEEPLWATRGVEEPVLSLDNPLCSVPLARRISSCAGKPSSRCGRRFAACPRRCERSWSCGTWRVWPTARSPASSTDPSAP